MQLTVLACGKEAIARKWLERTLEPYAEDSRRFLLEERDPFRNPIGTALRQGLPVLLDVVLEGKAAGDAAPALDSIMRIKAVQETDASRAASFVSGLGEILRRELDIGEPAGGRVGNRADLDSRIEALSLMAEQLFAECREQIERIKAGAARRSSLVSAKIAARRDARPEGAVLHRQSS